VLKGKIKLKMIFQDQEITRSHLRLEKDLLIKLEMQVITLLLMKIKLFLQQEIMLVHLLMILIIILKDLMFLIQWDRSQRKIMIIKFQVQELMIELLNQAQSLHIRKNNFNINFFKTGSFNEMWLFLNFTLIIYF